MGVEISGIDLSKNVYDSDFENILEYFKKYLAIFFPEQSLTVTQMSDFVKKFGNPLIHPVFKSLEGSKYVHKIKKNYNEKKAFGNVWHSDFTNLEKPSLANALYSIKVPDVGGDTLFCNMYLAYESLSEKMKSFLLKLNAVHGFSEKYKKSIAFQESKNEITKFDNDYINYKKNFNNEVVHPIIRTHPETKKKCLYVNPNFTLRINDLTSKESSVLLDYLYTHSSSPENLFRYSWQPKTLAIWDNRCTMHYAINDYLGHERVMHRMVVMEDSRPY